MLRWKVSAVPRVAAGNRERSEQRKFEDDTDRVCKDDRDHAENIGGQLSTESVHETGSGRSIKSLV